ncbi:MAG TPA: hypothetical protein VEC18_00390 [Myxococcota bacterium]|nr:hypothetical protein [Myxococcota bacterium]
MASNAVAHAASGVRGAFRSAIQHPDPRAARDPRRPATALACARSDRETRATRSSPSLSGWKALCPAALLWVGCAYAPTTSFEYDPAPVPVSSPSDRTIAVLPLEEARGPKHYPGLQGHLFKTYIPLLPYVKVPYERLDESHILHQENLGQSPAQSEHFTTAIAQQIASDLQRSGLFRQVEFVSDEKSASEHDLVLRGVLRSTEFDIFASSYMLGMPGVLLWFLPIPIGKDAATVAIDLTLQDDSGDTLWSYSFSERAGKLFTLYNSAGKSTSSRYRIEIKRYGSNDLGIDGNSYWAYHAEALRRGMEKAKISLAETILPRH